MKDIVKSVLLLAMFVTFLAGCTNTNSSTADNQQQEMSEEVGRPGEEKGGQREEKDNPEMRGEQRGGNGGPGKNKGQKGENSQKPPEMN